MSDLDLIPFALFLPLAAFLVWASGAWALVEIWYRAGDWGVLLAGYWALAAAWALGAWVLRRHG